MKRKKDIIPKRLKNRVFKRDGYRCRYCGSSEKPLHCDHVYPESRGGETTYNNLVTSCMRCNLKKHAKVGIWPLPLKEIEKILELAEENQKLTKDNEVLYSGNKKLMNDKKSVNTSIENGYYYLLISSSIPAILGFSYIYTTGDNDMTGLVLLLVFLSIFLIGYIYRRLYF